MAVTLDFLQPPEFARNLADGKYLYKDLKLDLQLGYNNTPQLLSPADFVDLEALYDVQSVYQSLNNIFNTLPGQKILNPGFGLDLRGYIFNKASTRVGYGLGLEITKKLPVLEPRIRITSVTVFVQPDELSYVVNIYFKIPSLESITTDTFNINVRLNSSGFTII